MHLERAGPRVPRRKQHFCRDLFSFCYCAVLFDAEGQEAVQQHEEVRQRVFVASAIKGHAILHETAEVVFVVLASPGSLWRDCRINFSDMFPLIGPEKPREEMRDFCN